MDTSSLEESLGQSGWLRLGGLGESLWLVARSQIAGWWLPHRIPFAQQVCMGMEVQGCSSEASDRMSSRNPSCGATAKWPLGYARTVLHVQS